MIEPVIKAIAQYLGKNSEEVFSEVKRNIIFFLKEQLESQILLHFREVLKRELSNLTNFTSKSIGDALIEIDNSFSEIDNSFSEIDKFKLFDNIKIEFEKVIDNEDYNSALKLFNMKKTLIPKSKVCELTGIRNKEEYLNLFLTLLKKRNETSDLIKIAIDNQVKKST